jgi:hypothetical protein
LTATTIISSPLQPRLSPRLPSRLPAGRSRQIEAGLQVRLVHCTLNGARGSLDLPSALRKASLMTCFIGRRSR